MDVRSQNTHGTFEFMRIPNFASVAAKNYPWPLLSNGFGRAKLTTMIINEKEKIQIAREIIRLRLSQMIVNEKCKSGEFKIPVHLALGHEALAIAVSSIMQGKDKLLLSHRNIAYNLARAPLLPIMNEYFLKPAGLAKGRFGSMNLINPRRGVAYTSSILGNQFAIAVGISMAEKLFDGKSI